MSELRRLEKPYHRLVIAGGGNIGFRLSKALEENYNIKIIEFSPERAAFLSEKLDHAVVLNGSALIKSCCLMKILIKLMCSSRLPMMTKLTSWPRC